MAPFVAQLLKLIGGILILSFLLDFIILAFPAQPRDGLWQIGFATAMVDRGITPMIGLALLLIGYWLYDRSDNALTKPPLWLSLKFWALLLSSLLGLLFLLVIPFHINNVNQESARAVERIERDSTQAEAQLQSQLDQLQAQLGDEKNRAQLENQKNQFKAQVTALLQNEQLYQQAIKSDRTPPEQKKLLQEFKANPQALEKYLAQQSDPVTLGKERLDELQQQKQKAQSQARLEALQSSIRMAIRGLLIAIGYIAIGWTGLRNMLSASKPV
ncbi:hypothetical protein UH38_16875 [Aliterella atlantica CENA595]|uniref:Uncharacterized protein n=1 Tax=Aliterella atlantica CENA595 TaxID=1618023 RepID=A0A0D8ZQY1_9CYAN|nr:hypothetical protein UH38_16875 [Aliterella atlantica CENA595]